MIRNSIRAIVLAGFISGTVDIGAAALIYHANPLLITQAIASGLLGEKSFSGGWQTEALGLALQWIMSWIIAAIFVIATRLIPFLSRLWILGGIAYGIGIYIVMNYVVVPLSNSYPKHGHTPPLDRIAEDLLAMILFGLIVAYFAKDTVRRTA